MYSTFGERLKAIRVKRKMSQEEFATILGTTKQVISRYETNQRTPKISVVDDYACILNVPLAQLLGDDKNPPAQVDEGIWKSICTDPTKLYMATLIAGLNHDQKIQVAKVLAAMLEKEIPPSVLE